MAKALLVEKGLGKKIQMMMDGSLWKGFCSGNKRVGDTVSACLDESCYGLGENAASFGGIFVALNILFSTFCGAEGK